MDPAISQWFYTVDQDRSGHINATELQQALTNANWSNFNLDTCRLMLGMFDRDYSGQIDMHEFHSLWHYIQQWKAQFDQLDRDRSGTINATELSTALSQLGYRLSPQFSMLVTSRFRHDHTQSLTLDNFIQACVMLKNVTDVFRRHDTQMRGIISINYDDFMSICVANKP